MCVNFFVLIERIDYCISTNLRVIYFQRGIIFYFFTEEDSKVGRNVRYNIINEDNFQHLSIIYIS